MSELIRDGVPSFYISAKNPHIPITHRMSDSDIPVWCKNSTDAFEAMRRINSAQPPATAPAAEFEPDRACKDSDGCPTELAVLKRFWREHNKAPAAVPDGYALVQRDHPVFKFLFGESSLDGCEYGDGTKPATERGYFWWRKQLRELLNAHPAQPAGAKE